jgi:hypothetical protein
MGIRELRLIPLDPEVVPGDFGQLVVALRNIGLIAKNMRGGGTRTPGYFISGFQPAGPVAS